MYTKPNGMTYVYVGPTEEKRYPAAGLAKFEQMFPVVFRQGKVTIYLVISEL
jgi:uncharacterized membrane protein